MDAAELLRHVSVLVFTPSGTVRCERTRHYQVHVTWRYEGQWSVTALGSSRNGKEWNFDSKDRTLFPLEEAVAAARTLVDTIEVNGLTWSQAGSAPLGTHGRIALDTYTESRCGSSAPAFCMCRVSSRKQPSP
jgi:hypothetical protein